MLLCITKHKKVFYLCLYSPILFLLTVSYGTAQRLSPLIQFMSSNTTIERPMVFREMQANIEKETGSTKPGVNADLLFKKIAYVKDNLLNKTKFSFHVEKKERDTTVSKTDKDGKVVPENKKMLRIEFSSNVNEQRKAIYHVEFEQKKSEKSIKSMLEEIEVKLRENLTEFCDQILPKDDFKVTKKSVVLALAIALKEKALLRNDNYDTDKPEELLSRILIELLQEYTINIAEKPLIEIDKPIENHIDAFITRVNRIGDSLTDKLRGILLEAFTPAEEKITELIKSYSRVLVSSNTGIGITEGTGMLNGGLHVNYNVGEVFQSGFYFNGELAREDTSQPSRSLVGTQLRLTWGGIQFDALGSYLFGDKNFNSNNKSPSFEYGVGITLKAGIIIGVCASVLQIADGKDNSVEGISNVMLTLRSSTPGTPIFMIGGAKNAGGSFNTVFNISLPFN